jgi:hypothetical protein
VCNEPTVRCYWPVPQVHNLKAWKKLAERHRRLTFRTTWRFPPEEPPKPFDFGQHLREKNAKYESPRPERAKKPKLCPDKKRRCHKDRPCQNCQARLALDVLAK